MRRQAVDRAGTMEEFELARGVFDGLLEVRIAGGLPWTLGLTWTAIDLIGLERLMTAMIDEPDKLHRLMAFLRDDMMQAITWAEREGVLTIHNTNGYVGSGGVAYTHELPQSDWKPGQPGRLTCDSRRSPSLTSTRADAWFSGITMPTIRCRPSTCLPCAIMAPALSLA